MPVGQNQRRAAALQLQQEGVIVAAGVDDQAIHPVFQKAPDGPPLPAGILPAVGKEDLIAGLLAHGGNALEQQGGEGAADIADDAADQHTAAGLQALGGTVGMIVHLGDDTANVLPGLGGHIFILAVQES